MTEITKIEFTIGMYCLDTQGQFHKVTNVYDSEGTYLPYFHCLGSNSYTIMTHKYTMRPFWVQLGDTVCLLYNEHNTDKYKKVSGAQWTDDTVYIVLDSIFSSYVHKVPIRFFNKEYMLLE